MSIRYLLIDTDGVGSFGTRPDPGYTSSWLDELVGPEGWDRVPLHPLWGMAGFVNDCGLLAPETYPRNVVGSVVLGTLGAAQHPYAGPVVITGWKQPSDWELCGLTDAQVEELTRCLSDVRRVLGLEPGKPSGHAVPAWAADVRSFAAAIPTAETPGIRVLSGDEALAALLGLKRGAR